MHDLSENSAIFMKVSSDAVEGNFVYSGFVSAYVLCDEDSDYPFFISNFSIYSLLFKHSDMSIVSFAILYRKTNCTAIFKILILELNRLTNHIKESVLTKDTSSLIKFTNESDGINITFKTK